jgi:hypothetical protein
MGDWLLREDAFIFLRNCKWLVYLGIDAFLSAFIGQYTLIHRGYPNQPSATYYNFSALLDCNVENSQHRFEHMTGRVTVDLRAKSDL